MSIETIKTEAEKIQKLPDMGWTKYMVRKEDWDNFYDWLYTIEAQQKMDANINVLELVRYYAYRYINKMEEAEIYNILNIEKWSKLSKK